MSVIMVIIFDDYNARLRNMQNFVLPYTDIFKMLRKFLTWFEQTSRFVSPQRQNPDRGINNYGSRLIDFCCDNSLYIMNGGVVFVLYL